jgi:hypothetical protein
MTKYRKLIGTGIAAATAGVIAVGLTVGSAQSEMKMPFGDKDSVAYSKSLWSALEKAGLAGANAKAGKPYKGQPPHGAILETTTSEVTVGGHKGTVVVKRNYGGEGVSTDAVAKDRGKFLAAVTVMFKREAGYDKDNKDWFWVKYKADGTLHTNPKGMMLAGRVAKGMDKGCIACHAGAPGGDYLFTN